VGLSHPDINVLRVQARVSQGGHHIDEAVIRKRFLQSQENLKILIGRKLADKLCVIDNSDKCYCIGFATKNQNLIFVNNHIEFDWIKEVGQSLFE
jgi:predicted ABC-type ATPase